MCSENTAIMKACAFLYERRLSQLMKTCLIALVRLHAFQLSDLTTKVSLSGIILDTYIRGMCICLVDYLNLNKATLKNEKNNWANF